MHAACRTMLNHSKANLAQIFHGRQFAWFQTFQISWRSANPSERDQLTTARGTRLIRISPCAPTIPNSKNESNTNMTISVCILHDPVFFFLTLFLQVYKRMYVLRNREIMRILHSHYPQALMHADPANKNEILDSAPNGLKSRAKEHTSLKSKQHQRCAPPSELTTFICSTNAADVCGNHGRLRAMLRSKQSKTKQSKSRHSVAVGFTSLVSHEMKFRRGPFTLLHNVFLLS